MKATKRKTTKSRKPARKVAAKKTTARRRNKTVIKAKRVTVFKSNPKRTATKRATKKHVVRRRNKPARISEADLAKLPAHIQAQFKTQLGKVEKQEAKASTPTQIKAVERKHRSLLSRLGTRLRVLGQTKTYKVSARDIARAPRRTIKVRARHESDALSKARAKLSGGFDEFKVQNGGRRAGASPVRARAAAKKRAVRNPRYLVFGQDARGREHDLAVLVTPNKVQAVKKAKAIYGAAGWSKFRAELSDKADYIGRTGMVKAKRPRRLTRKANASSAPATRALYEKFGGRKSTKATTLAAPNGTPANVAKLGRLRLVKTVDGRSWKFDGNKAPYLTADARGKLHVIGGQYRANPTGQSLGQIEKIEYEASKPHLGYKAPVIWFHELGEENGKRPTLKIDGEGLMKFCGGDYRIERDGIHN